MNPEFTFIQKYFMTEAWRTLGNRGKNSASSISLGIGDDAALVTYSAGQTLAITTDTLIADTHFDHQTPAADVGYKALAVNLSDLAAMGADPNWFTLALSMPQIDSTWLDAFVTGLYEIAVEYQVPLIGGDSCCGPLSITIQIAGSVADEHALRRDMVQIGDDVYVSGCLGDAALGLVVEQSGLQLSASATDYLLQRLRRPTPRVSLGRELLGVAHAAIDISDGLSNELNQLCLQSQVAILIDLDLLPASACLQLAPITAQQRLSYQLTGGDDYELCFTASPQVREAIQRAAQAADVPVSRIGKACSQQQLKHEYPQQLGPVVYLSQQQPVTLNAESGYSHF